MMAETRGWRCRRSSAWNREQARQLVAFLRMLFASLLKPYGSAHGRSIVLQSALPTVGCASRPYGQWLHIWKERAPQGWCPSG